MTKSFKLLIFFLFPAFGFAQTMTTTGNWDNAANWTGSNIGDLISEDVILNNSVDPTIQTGFNYTIGNLTTGNNNDLIVQSGASLTLGASGNPKNLTTNNGATLSIAGTLIVWGDLVVNNGVTWNVTGTVIIKGNVILGNNGVITVGGTGTVQIDGNFTGGNNTALTVNGNVSIGGNLSVGNGSTAAGTGTVSVAGSCSDGGSTFCDTGPLPASLLFFAGKLEGNRIITTWATASELNFDYFDVERSANARDFMSIGKVTGHGTSNVRHDYSLVDEKPLIGKNYYRLKSVDFDNYTEYFKVLAVDFSGEKSFLISPNPSDGTSLGFSLNFTPAGNSTIIVFDNLGNIIGVYKPSDYSESISFGNSLKGGIYYAKIISDDFVRVERFVVR